jgi:outer membrane protein
VTRRGLVVAAACFACAFSLRAQEPKPAGPLRLTLLDALDRALSANARVGRARAEVLAADAQRRVSLSFILPRLNALGSVTRNSTEVSFGTDTQQRVILPQNDWRGQLVLTQPVFAGLREKRAYDQAKENAVSARHGVVNEEDQVVIRVAREYLAVAAAEALLDVSRQTLALAGKRQRQAQNLFDAGETTRVDVLRAETAIKQAEREIAQAQRDREAALGQLRVDLAYDGEIEIASPDVRIPALPSEQELIARAAESRADLRQAQIALRVASLEVQKQSGAYFPVVTAEAGYIRQKTSFPTDRYGYATLHLNVPLFQGGEIGARVAQAKEFEHQAQLTYEETQRVVREDVRRAVLDARTAATQQALSEEQRSAAEAEYNQVFEQYSSQELTSLDVAASENTLADARRTAAIDKLNRQLAELTVWYSVGGVGATVRNLKEAHP